MSNLPNDRLPAWAKPHEIKGKFGIILLLHLQPGASTLKIKGPYGDRLKISVQSPPIDGKANKALVEFLADLLDLPPSKFQIISGLTSRQKNIFIETARVAEIISLLVR